MSSDEDKSIWGFVKNAAAKAKTATDEARHKNLQKRVRTAINNAASVNKYDDVARALSNIPGNWEELEFASLKQLTKSAVVPLEDAVRSGRARLDEEERAAAEQERRDKRFFEVMAELNDDAATATFDAAAVMSKDERRNFKQVLNSRQPSGNSVHDSYVGGGVGAIASGGFPEGVLYGCLVGQIPEGDRQLLRVAATLMRQDIVRSEWFEKAYAGAIYSAGQRRIYEGQDQIQGGTARQIARETLEQSLPVYLVDSNILKQEIVSLTTKLQRENPNSPVVQELSGAGGGSHWFTSADAVNSIYQLKPGKGLFIGQLEDGGFLHYDGEGSLFTIAPPGSGKTQCQVMPNLIMYNGPAIVLDVKGECYEQTAGVRSYEIGPVLRFAPDDWANSSHYNPLDFVRDDPRHLASDARKLADMLIVPQATSDPYWEQRGRDVLAALIGFVALRFDAHERNMKSVMDLLSPSASTLENVLEAMRETDVPFLERAANQIEGMSEKQLSSIFDSARSQLSVWDLGELDPITDRSDWHPRDFKTGDKPLTLYLCVGPADIDRFASVLRVIIGQHLDYFMDVLPDNVERPIVFFLDEAPQLGSFEPLPKAASLGRQYGLRLWLFAQNRNQIETAYKSADTILGNSVVQCWMNPDEHAAQSLERHLGVSRNIFTGQEEPLVRSQELRGPTFKDTIICVGRGEKPAKLAKHFAYKDESLKESMGLPIARFESTE